VFLPALLALDEPTLAGVNTTAIISLSTPPPELALPVPLLLGLALALFGLFASFFRASSCFKSSSWSFRTFFNSWFQLPMKLRTSLA
jgi:hypothetical protein